MTDFKALLPGPIEDFIPQVVNAFETTSRVYTLDARDWGVVGNGTTDDTAALNTFFDEAPNFSHLLLPLSAMKITDTLVFNNKKGCIIGTHNSLGPSSISQGEPRFIWAGANGGTMMDLGHNVNCEFRGFSLFMNSGGATDGADVGIILHQDGPGLISSSNLFDHVAVHGFSTRPALNCVLIGGVLTSNSEFMTFQDCVFLGSSNPTVNAGVYGTSACINLAGSFNTKGLRFRNCLYGFANWAIRCHRGSFHCDGADIQMVCIAYEIEENSDPVLITNGVGEGIRNCLTILAPNNPIICIGNLWEAFGTTGAGITYPRIDMSAGELTLLNNNFGDFRTFGQVGYDPAVVNLVDGHGQARVYGRGNMFYGLPPHVMVKNWGTCAVADVCDQGDVNINGFAPGPALAVCQTAGQSGQRISYDLFGANGLRRQGFGITGPAVDVNRVTPADRLFIADSIIEFEGMPNPNPVLVHTVGTVGTTSYQLSVIAIDADGNKTQKSQPIPIHTANATLSGSNYLHVTWRPIPDAVSYDLINCTALDGGTLWQLVANITVASLSDPLNPEYDIVANPTGATTYPADGWFQNKEFNHGQRAKFRNPVRVFDDPALDIYEKKAILDLRSTTRGVLMPRMTTTQKNAISSPPAGLEVFDTTTGKKNVYSGSVWVALDAPPAIDWTAPGTIGSATRNTGEFTTLDVFGPYSVGGVPVVTDRQADIISLTDNVGGTVSDTLAALTIPADTPATADALRDDLVANLIPGIQDALSSIAAKQEEIMAMIRVHGLMGVLPTPFITTINSGSLRSDFTGCLGFKFTTPGTGPKAVALGRQKVSGNTGIINVYLKDNTGVTVASVALDMSTGAAGDYIWGPISEALSASSVYYLMSQETSGGNQWREAATVTADSGAVTLNNAVYQGSCTGTINIWLAGQSYIPVNIRFL